MIKRLLTIAAILLSAYVIYLAFQPSPAPVEVALVKKAEFLKTIEDDGKTRPIDRYDITAPVRGNLLRIDFIVGDTVAKDQVVAKIIPATSQLLDVREELQLEQRKESAKAAKLRSEVIAKRAEAELKNAKMDLKRGQELSKKGFVSKAELDKLTLNVEVKSKEYESAQHGVESAISEFKRTEFALKHFKRAYTAEKNIDSTLEITSPIDGNIIKIHRKSEGAIMSGSNIMEVADVNQIEIVTDILSTDAVKIPDNAKVIIKRWGGPQNLIGTVHHIEPGGFTKVSALGVEEQRVNVITRITSPKDEWKNLKAGFQLDTEIILYRLDQQILVPVSALFRDGEQWAVFLLDGSTTRLTHIELTDRNPQVAIVKSGLKPGDRVVIYPGDRVKNDMKVSIQ